MSIDNIHWTVSTLNNHLSASVYVKHKGLRLELGNGMLVSCWKYH